MYFGLKKGHKIIIGWNLLVLMKKVNIFWTDFRSFQRSRSLFQIQEYYFHNTGYKTKMKQENFKNQLDFVIFFCQPFFSVCFSLTCNRPRKLGGIPSQLQLFVKKY